MKSNQVNQKSQVSFQNYSCPNCWGHQEYEDRIIEKDEQPDSTQNDGFILKFVKKYLSK